MHTIRYLLESLEDDTIGMVLPKELIEGQDGLLAAELS